MRRLSRGPSRRDLLARIAVLENLIETYRLSLIHHRAQLALEGHVFSA